jgi:hypothetical protein
MLDDKVIVWPDRVGLAFSALMFAASLILVIFGTNPYPDTHHPMWIPVTQDEFRNLMSIFFEPQLYFALPLWLFVRMVDFVLGGPKRRYEARLDQEFRETNQFFINEKYGWEPVHDRITEDYFEYTHRMAVPEGWLYKFETGRGEARACSITFVPSKPHKRY